MLKSTHGRCRHCKVIFQWTGKPLLRDALCPRCIRPLDRTAANLAKHIPVVSEHPCSYVEKPLARSATP